MTRTLTAIAFFAGLAVANFAVPGPSVGHADPAAQRSYGANQGISQTFGSKRAVGYFAAKDGACALTMFLAEAEDGHVAPSAARVKLTVRPGETVELGSVEGEAIQVKCGKDASAVELQQTSFTSAPRVATVTQ
jgi:hypothetical protein